MNKSIQVFARKSNSINKSIQVFARKSNSLYRFICKSSRERVILCIDLYVSLHVKE